MIQELSRFKIDTGNIYMSAKKTENIIINQVLYPESGSKCNLCCARQKMQQKYLDQIEDLYEDFHKVKLPLLPNEIRVGHIFAALIS